MGLKINNALGTDQGITNEGYIRITNYNNKMVILISE
jgi:hypothetical protein